MDVLYAYTSISGTTYVEVFTRGVYTVYSVYVMCVHCSVGLMPIIGKHPEYARDPPLFY